MKEHTLITCIIKELNNYNIPQIKSSSFFKKVYNDIQPFNFQPTHNITTYIVKARYTLNINKKMKSIITRKFTYFCDIKFNIQSSSHYDIIHYGLTSVDIKNKNIIQEILHNNVYKMIYYVNICKSLFNNNKTIEITFFNNDMPKHMPSHGILSEFDCNSAYCNVMSYKNGPIMIYRNEEMYKILLHELMHSMHIDYELINMSYKGTFCKGNNFLLNESYAEVLSMIMDIAIKNKLYNGTYRTYIEMINNTYKYTYLNAIKILNYNKSNGDLSLYLNKKQCKIFNENTNVFSYYILKPLMLQNMSYFNNISSYKISKAQLPLYLKYIISLLNTTLSIINIKHNTCIYKTLRMVLY